MDTALTANLVVDHDTWLEERRHGIGASEAAAALGLSPWSSPRELWLQKLGKAPKVVETEAMRWGNLQEPLIAREYSRRTGREVVAQQVFLKHTVETHLFATLDGMTDAGYPVEFKTVGPFNASEIGDEGTSDLPEHWVIQAHQQMFVSATERVDFAVLIGGQELRNLHVNRDDALLEEMLPRLAEFWASVQSCRMPDQVHHADYGLLSVLYPGCEGEVELTVDDQATVDRWLQMGPDIREMESARKMYKSAILERMGNAAIGYLPDGRVLTRKIINVAESQVTRAAYSYPDLKVKKARPN